jgi:hypothetical protein
VRTPQLIFTYHGASPNQIIYVLKSESTSILGTKINILWEHTVNIKAFINEKFGANVFTGVNDIYYLYLKDDYLRYTENGNLYFIIHHTSANVNFHKIPTDVNLIILSYLNKKDFDNIISSGVLPKHTTSDDNIKTLMLYKSVSLFRDFHEILRIFPFKFEYIGLYKDILDINLNGVYSNDVSDAGELKTAIDDYNLYTKRIRLLFYTFKIKFLYKNLYQNLIDLLLKYSGTIEDYMSCFGSILIMLYNGDTLNINILNDSLDTSTIITIFRFPPGKSENYNVVVYTTQFKNVTSSPILLFYFLTKKNIDIIYNRTLGMSLILSSLNKKIPIEDIINLMTYTHLEETLGEIISLSSDIQFIDMYNKVYDYHLKHHV